MKSRFRRTPVGTLLTPEQRERQGRVAAAAHAALDDIEAVRDFLNSEHKGLGGRPLDLAIASDEGLAAVEAALDKKRKAA